MQNVAKNKSMLIVVGAAILNFTPGKKLEQKCLKLAKVEVGRHDDDDLPESRILTEYYHTKIISFQKEIHTKKKRKSPKETRQVSQFLVLFIHID